MPRGALDYLLDAVVTQHNAAEVAAAAYGDGRAVYGLPLPLVEPHGGHTGC
jgi:hypothetical protein